LLYIIF